MQVFAPCIGFPSTPRIKKELVEISTTQKNHKNPQKKYKTHKTNKKTIKTKKTNKKTIKQQKHKNSTLTMFSANADGLNKKVHSLKYQIKSCNAGIFTIQETNFKKKGRFQLDNFEIFESI